MSLRPTGPQLAIPSSLAFLLTCFLKIHSLLLTSSPLSWAPCSPCSVFSTAGVCVCSWRADSEAGHSGPAPLSSDSSCFCVLALKEDGREVGVQALRSGAAQQPGPVRVDAGHGFSLTPSYSSGFFGWDLPLGEKWPHASPAALRLSPVPFSLQGRHSTVQISFTDNLMVTRNAYCGFPRARP